MGPGSKTSGFTLVETLVAIAVLAIGMLGVLALQSTLITSARFSQDLSNASLLLQLRVDELSAKTTAEAVLVCGGPAPGCATPARTLDAAPGSGCRVRTVSPVPMETKGLGLFPPSGGRGGPYTIDTGVLAHPDVLNHPNSMIGYVSVCWADNLGRMKMIQTSRVLGNR